MSTAHPFLDAFLKGRFSVLLVSLALLFMVVPLIPGDQTFVDKMSGIFVLVVIVRCLRSLIALQISHGQGGKLLPKENDDG